MSLRTAVEEAWERPEDKAPSPFELALMGFEGVFKTAVTARRRAYDRGWLAQHRASLPVISVGNITVGGTGKTPITRWIVDCLVDAGRTPAVVLRGYGGDETDLHRSWYPDVPVVAEADRVVAAEKAASLGADIVVCDDAFQHRRLGRDLDLVVVSADDRRPVRLLPAGPYREPPAALHRADAILVSRKSEDSPHLPGGFALPSDCPSFEVTFGAGRWTRVGGGPRKAPAGPVLIFTALGAPQSVPWTVAEALGLPRDQLEFELVTYPDHHAYTELDLTRLVERAGTRPLVTTEKDAIKLMGHNELTSSVHVLGLEVRRVDRDDQLRTLLTGVGGS